MRAVIQRCHYVNLSIGGEIYSSINIGLLILLGIGENDNIDDVKWLSGKISKLRIFDDNDEKMNLSVQDIKGQIMIVSQFTLFASTKKGNRPSYLSSAKPDKAMPLYEEFTRQIKSDTDLNIVTGKFGANMKIELLNDGPVTIIIDSKNRE